MESLVMTTLFVVLSALLTPSANSLQIQLQSSYHQTGNEVLQHSSLPALPRKLKLFETTVKGYGSGHQDFQSYNTQIYKEYVAPGESKEKEQVVVHGSKGTWKEWVEGGDTSEYFTMDYSKVRRRRPVHNKSLPVGP
ncbi:protein GOLVEN 6 [Alnus glutinosa]|uniref:protein GOLVEN 6 n=1 Tax=Alnus glutinosa TaxID=3517 RepID=UPI002D78C192|nr:protein GOLVEN 6 [Alnus glutinosa]